MFASRWRVASVLVIAPVLLVSTFVGVVGAQGFPQLSDSSNSFLGSAFGSGASPQSFLSFGNLGACGDSALVPYLGIFSAGYDYNSFSQVGVTFNELKLMYTLPLLLDNGDAVRGFALAYITDIKDSAQAFGIADTLLRFGGSWRTRLSKGFWVGARGEYDAIRRLGKWYSGGQAAIQIFECIGTDTASLRVTYYAESAGDQLIFPKNPTGYGVDFWYAHDLFSCGPRLMLTASGYDYGTGLMGGDQRGWTMGGNLRFARGLFTVNGIFGHDSILLDNYTVGAYCNLAF